MNKSPIGIVNVDVDLLNAVAMNGRVAIKLWQAGGSILAKAEAPSKDNKGQDRLAWMEGIREGKTEPLLGQKYVQSASYEGKTVQVVRNITVGCAHLFKANASQEA